MTAPNLSNTRCFVDFDGTIANSLNWYNEALDDLVMGKLTNKHYIDYYHDFGDHYDLIPGCPWRYIVIDLIEYLSKSHPTPVYRNSDSSRFHRRSETYDIGALDSLMLVAYDAKFCKCSEIFPAASYFDGAVKYTAILDERLSGKDVLEYVRKQCPHKEVTVICSNEQRDALSSHGLDAHSYKEVMVQVHSFFEKRALEHLGEKTYEQLALEPVVQFLKAYKEAGGTIYIHSGSNKSFVDFMLDKMEISELFDDILCSSMLTEDEMDDYANVWGGYKILLLDKLIENHPAAEGMQDFVVGDTKGDGFGAYECALPFFLVWRGYPENPPRLQREDEFITPNGYIDARQKIIDEAFADGTSKSVFKPQVESLMKFAEEVSRGEAPHMEIEEKQPS